MEGIELNLNRVEYCRGRGLKVYPTLIQDFVSGREEEYNVICAFEVIEHVAEVQEFYS